MTDATGIRPEHGILHAIAPNVRHILAPNPSSMTFWGTNTYVIGQGQVAVIDPGPEDAAHLAALLTGLGDETVTHIFVTHAHKDHASLARVLAQETGAPIYAFGDALAGRSAVMEALAGADIGGGEGVDLAFVPDHILCDGDVVMGQGWRLVAHHTPGHMGNHVCFALGDMVFSGDHVMEWSTSLISPPDGDMAAFVASCVRLQSLQARIMWPGHGPAVHDPAARLSTLIAHRRAREAQILAALAGKPLGIAEITKAVYGNIAPNLHPAAARNVFAHLIDLTMRQETYAAPTLGLDARFQRTYDL